MTKQEIKPSSASPHNVIALIYDGLCAFEFGICSEVFGLPRPELETELYTFESVSLEPSPLKMSGGLKVVASARQTDLIAADTIIVPGWRGADKPVPVAYCAAIRAAHDRGVRLVAICSGVYVLAAAGVLDGRAVTTHWKYADDLASKFPKVSVQANELYIHDGTIVTSAGSSAGIDACLHIVRSDYGAKIATSVARRLVMHAHRQGDQAQYIECPIPQSNEVHRLSKLMDDVQSRLSDDHSIKSMSIQAGMSTRTFQRRFIKLTGLSPVKWVTQERINYGRMLLETTTLSIDQISDKVGFSNPETLRYHFRQILDISPTSYRKRFIQTPSQ